MRAGWLVSLVGHVGAVLMTLLAWEASSPLVASGGSVVPVEIVDIGPESNVRALAVDVPDEEEVSPDAADEIVEARPEPASAPSPRGQQREQSYEDWLRETEVGLQNTDIRPRPRQNQGQDADRNQEGAGPGTAAVVALRDRVNAVGKAHLRRCWRMPIDLPDPERLIITVEFDLNRNGTLNGQPRVTAPRNYTFDPYMRAAAENALRAVRQCDPYPFADDPVLRDHYNIWRQTEVVFDPSHF